MLSQFHAQVNGPRVQVSSGRQWPERIARFNVASVDVTRAVHHPLDTKHRNFYAKEDQVVPMGQRTNARSQFRSLRPDAGRICQRSASSFELIDEAQRPVWVVLPDIGGNLQQVVLRRGRKDELHTAVGFDALAFAICRRTAAKTVFAGMPAPLSAPR